MRISGTVRLRPQGMVNPRMATGEVEVLAQQIEVLNEAKTPVFYINEDAEIDEALRLRYRYLDLRRERLQRNLILRHNTVRFIREHLSQRGFIEIETPILIKSTPEGARDYVVPSRLHAGTFYALPQSPQQLKQLLMVAGYERYFQIARCFRDEDQRADRQPEFTQLDVENVVRRREDVMRLTEAVLPLVPAVSNKRILYEPFPRFTYDEALARFGSDKPDIRFGMELIDLSDCCRAARFACSKRAGRGRSGQSDRGARVCGLYAQATRRHHRVAKRRAPKALLDGRGRRRRAASIKFLTEAETAGIIARTQAQAGDLILLVADASRKVVAEALGTLRLSLVAASSCWMTTCWRCLDRRLSAAGVERRGEQVRGRAPSVHGGHRRGPADVGNGSLQGARQGLRCGP